MWFKEWVASITGGSKDGQVGLTLAQTFAQEGALTVLTAREARDLEVWAQEMRERGAEVLTVAADLTDEQARQEYKYFGLSD